MATVSLTAVPARADGPRPAVLVLPGGGYGHQADHEAEPVAEWLASLGIHAYVLRYRVAPHRHPAPLEDAKTALLQIRSESGGPAVDATRVGVLGFSAGGHLAATLSTAVATGNAALDVRAAVPDLTVLCYPVVSCTEDVHQGSVDNLLGASPSDDLLREVSADLHVTAATPRPSCGTPRMMRSCRSITALPTPARSSAPGCPPNFMSSRMAATAWDWLPGIRGRISGHRCARHG